MRFLLILHGTDHYKQARQLRNAVLRLPLRMVLTKDDVAGEEKQLHFVAMENDLVVGTVTMKPLSPTEMQLRQMAISPSLQGKGVGRQLVTFAENALKAYGVQTIRTNARIVAQKFYSNMGYLPEGEPFIDHTLPHVKMSKKL